MTSKTNTDSTDYPVLFFETEDQWTEWLHKNHDKSNGVWLKFAKKASGMQSVNNDTTLEPALCYGWIDGQSKGLDDTFYLQKYTPRRARSTWSARNVGIVERLIAEGKMKPAGQAEIDRAKADGRWEQAYDSPANITMPEDFQKALDANPKAQDFYSTLNKTNTYAILWHIASAKKPETRARRIEKLIDMLNRGEKIY